MDDFALFERQVEAALSHLYDPAYHPEELLSLHLGFPTPQPLNLIRERLVQAIEQLEPTIDVPASARVRRIYDLLNLRYLQAKTQKETALRLGITVRHLRREQQLAIHLVAEQLWAQAQKQPFVAAQSIARPSTIGLLAEEAMKRGDQAEADWREQVHREIQSLQCNSPGLLANVQETLMAIVEVARALTAGAASTLEVKPLPSDLLVAAHPAVLRELLIAAVDNLVPALQPGSVAQFSVDTVGDHVKFVLEASPVTPVHLPGSKFIDEVLEIYGGNLAVRRQHNRVEFNLILPQVTPIRVLVVDDNDDLVHFYRRYTEGTRYVIEHVAHGQQLCEKLNLMASHQISQAASQEVSQAITPSDTTLAAARRLGPDVIVLDIMLPDIGGWDVLRRLRKDSLTQDVPIIICSVIQHEELARTLGATYNLSKPVHRNEFLQALDTVTYMTNPSTTFSQQQPRYP